MKKEKKDQKFEQFYNATYKEINNYIKLLYRCKPEETCDFLQDVYLTAYEKFEIVSKHQNPIGWMKVTARNKYLQYFRKKSLTEKLSIDQYCFYKELSLEDDYSFLLLEDLKKILSIDEYEMFLTYVQGYFSSKELANIKRVSDQAIRSKLSRIRKRLQKYLLLFTTC